MLFSTANSIIVGIYGYFLPEKYSFLAIDALCYCLYLCPKILGNSINIKNESIKESLCKADRDNRFHFLFSYFICTTRPPGRYSGKRKG
jgi:hypothetical protein